MNVRADFPILDRQVHGRPLVYLDSGATSQKPRQVIDAMADYYERYNANVHRGIHLLAEEATAAYELAREKVANFVNGQPRGTVFVRGTTEATNLVAYAWARRNLKPGDEIWATVMEHHSNIVPWQLAAADTGAVMRYIGVTDDGELEGFQPTEKCKLLCVTGQSNVLGTIIDVRSLADKAHAVGALVLVDGAQLVPHAPADFEAMGADFLAFSAHKMLGPTGIGALVARPELLETMHPFHGGGEMILNVTLEGATFNDIPYKFEGGTPAVAEAIGFGAAVDYLNAIGMDAVREHELELTRYGLKALSEIEDIVLYGPSDPMRRGATFSFNVGDGAGDIVHPHDMGTMLDQDGVAIRAGHHCAKPLMQRYDVPATCRASCYVYTTTDEIDALVASIERTRLMFSRKG